MRLLVDIFPAPAVLVADHLFILIILLDLLN